MAETPDTPLAERIEAGAKRGRGRPKGSKTRAKKRVPKAKSVLTPAEKRLETVMSRAVAEGALSPVTNVIVAAPLRPAIDLGGAQTVAQLPIGGVSEAVAWGYTLGEVAAHLNEVYERSHGHRPDADRRATAVKLLEWVEADPERLRSYRMARRIHAQSIFCDILTVAKEEVPKNIFGGFDSGAVADKRLRVSTLQWVASKLAPQDFGEKLDITSGDKPLDLTAEQIDARIDLLLSKMTPKVENDPS